MVRSILWSMPPPHVTLLVPCFNEEARIDDCLHAIADWRRSQSGLRVEVIVVDDGSADGTRGRAEAFAASDPAVRVLAAATNQGKGAALRRGMAEAAGRYVVFLDADLSVDLGHVEAVLQRLEAGADLAVGCRNVPGANVARPQRLARRSLGRGYRVLARLLLGIDAPDVTCGFKGFRREAGQTLFARSRCNGFGFDAEVLALARRQGLRTEGVPVTWLDGGRSTVRLGRDLPRALFELLAARMRLFAVERPSPAPSLHDTAAAPTE